MKKLVYLLMAVCLLAALVPIATSAHTEGDPLVVDLLAGQTEDIGNLLVWNDADTLYVKFVYDGPECGFLEVHLQVDEGSFSEDILTKKGNPIPGQFEKSYSGGCFPEHTFTYDLAAEGFECDDELVIAAHAALGREEAMAIVSGDGQTIVTQRRSGNASGFTPLSQPAILAWEPGPNYPNDGPDDSAWEAWSLWDQRLSINLVPTGADWIWEGYRVVDPVYGTVLTFQRTFDIGYPIDGNLLIACDNGYEVFLNGASVGSHGVYGAWRTSDLRQGYVPQDGWNVVGTYPLLDYLLDGTNTLTIDAANEYFNTDDPPNPYLGTQSNNPGACIFAADIDYYADGETAWGCRTGNCYDFDGRNWATYFGYTIQCQMPEVWPEGGTITVGFEDLALGGSLDYDYNDWVVDIDTLATFWGTSTDRDLTSMEFTIIPEARGAGYNHVSHMLIPADTFGCDGTYTLVLYDGVGGTLSTSSGTFVASVANDFTVIPDTTTALPGTLTNTIEPTGIVSHYPNINNTDPAAPQHQPYVSPKRTAKLSIDFGAGCAFDFAAYDPYSGFHGEGLFFDPYLYVINTDNNIHTGDARMLAVPADWMWPEAGVGIWLAYPGATQGDPPTFGTGWWENYNDLVYDGKP